MFDSLLRRQKALGLVTLLSVLLFSSLLFAQSDAGAGALRGEISTADGKAAVNATVTVRNAETGYAR